MKSGSHLSLAAAVVLGLAVSPQAIQANELPDGGTPMTVYLAKGGPNACGPGCSEWIAAEGTIGIGSAARLRAVVARSGKQKLPVFFHSPGGLIGEALPIGRFLRQKGLIAGVARTKADGCADEKAKECAALKKSDKKLDADLQIELARCASACVYAVLGGKTRIVWPGTRLGVHAGLQVRIKGGRVLSLDTKSKSEQAPGGKQFDQNVRAYIREMGIDVRLFEVAQAVPHEKIHYLTRDQIAQFGIDRSEFHETPWKFTDSYKSPEISKFFLEAKGLKQKEFPSSNLRMTCKGRDGVLITYFHGLTAKEESKLDVKLAVAGRGNLIAAYSQKKFDWLENGRLFDVRVGVSDFTRLQAHLADTMDLTETLSSDPAAEPHVIKLSSIGWSEAVGKLHQKCMGSE